MLELLALNLPVNYRIVGDYLNSKSQKIEVMALGSSQVRCSFNPELSNKPAINLASSSQHHKEDFSILKGTIDRLPNLKYVLFEVSYMHLELPYHPREYWKNNIYLKYYAVNAFERTTYFTDKLVFVSNPRFYSAKLRDHYLYKSNKVRLNKFGFDTNNYYSSFNKLGYDTSKIKNNAFKIYTGENLEIFKNNSGYLFNMLDYMQSKNLKVIIATLPLYKTYLNKRNPKVVHRRDSILSIVKSKYNNVVILNKETDTIQFKVKDFLNENHLNPDGARKFTSIVSKVVDSIN
ncbi:hypothetical protein [Aequorivita lipolytica]|uniref:SGNH/GDSL hydrolase family protein n=1 Tax=Aequorivita lipolytica TaxID=153267 RepID=A0A5C6YM59_9FLAO|nr:hypothetical protein [Aequorivita lipolytica]TXD68015.1 hypothetical protein ESV24_13980 [Aequorivita lipolytica]